MTRYIQRHSALKRWVHGIHMAACMVLILSGLVIFVPAIGRAAGTGVVDAVRIAHRVFAVVFIGGPIIGVLLKPSMLGHTMKNLFAKWDKDDKRFAMLFFPYLFASKKIHMPKQHESKSGQRIADGTIILCSILIAISGIVLWAGSFVSPVVFNVARLVHDIAFLGIVVFVTAHAYLGAGVFQPYRGIARIMFGDGLVSEADARYHWGYWAEDELKSGEKVVVVDD
ncbi:MAG: cytochrome b/b6 domain-containing protein [Coriobacteriia bacterium]